MSFRSQQPYKFFTEMHGMINSTNPHFTRYAFHRFRVLPALDSPHGRESQRTPCRWQFHAIWDDFSCIAMAIFWYAFSCITRRSVLIRIPGVLYKGCTSSVNIADCYQLSLTANVTQQLDPGFPDSPRQRIEFRSETQADGSSFKYTWKQFLYPNVGTTRNFFHLMQVFSMKDSGPVVTLDAVSGKAAVNDFFRSCTDTKCPSIDIASYAGRLTQHTLVVTFGPNGKLSYIVSDPQTKKVLLTYNVTGYMGSGGS
jgi:hypothetical protein